MIEVSEEDRRNWHAREVDRFYDGKYTMLPNEWRNKWWFTQNPATQFHFAHVSLDSGAMVAYTENDQKGVQDRQTKTTPGRYLKRFFNEWLTDTEIRDYATTFDNYYKPVELQVSQDADKIEWVYTHGPRSCMSNRACDYEANIHPARVYAGPDLGVAWIQRGEQVTARCVVWPNKKWYSRIYGDAVRMLPALNEAGYKEECAPAGARIRRIKYRGDFVMPYVDYVNYADDNGTYLILGHGGDLVCSNTCGLSADSRVECQECGDRHYEDDMSQINGEDGYYCSSCYEECTFYCDFYHDTYHINERIELGNGDTWSQRAVNRYAFLCPILDEYFPKTEGVEMADGEMWSQDGFDREGHVNEHGENVPNDQAA
jgi:hypothetical protein